MKVAARRLSGAAAVSTTTANHSLTAGKSKSNVHVCRLTTLFLFIHTQKKLHEYFNWSLFKVLYREERGIKGSLFSGNHRKSREAEKETLDYSDHQSDTRRPGPGANPSTGSEPEPPQVDNRSTALTSKKQNCSVEKLFPPSRPESSTLSNQLHFRNTPQAPAR